MPTRSLKTFTFLVALTLTHLAIGSHSATKAEPRKSLPNATLIYDLSNSMWAPLEGTPKVTHAQNGIFSGLKGLNKKVNLAVISFGHTEKTGCDNKETLTTLTPLDETKIKLALSPLRPRGNAPTAKAMLEAANLTKNRSTPYTIILLTDGPSNCPLNACETANRLKKDHPHITIDVLAIGPKNTKNLAPLSCISTPSSGTFTQVSNQEEIASALKASLKRAAKRHLQKSNAPQKVAETTKQDWMGATEIIVAPTKKEITGAVEEGAEENKSPFDTAARNKTHGGLALIAQLKDQGAPIRSGLVWRIYQEKPDKKTGKHKLVSIHKTAEPVMSLPAGTYLINAAYGRAFLTRKVSVKKGLNETEKFILNAGGLKISSVLANGNPVPENTVQFDIYSDERDQFGKRLQVLSKVRPGLVVRLNAGIYHIVSTYGDANAQSRADVSVEAGKLTETAIDHKAAKVTFKLVYQTGGEALADTTWSLLSATGKVIKKSAGALPTHFLAAGDYTLLAERGGKKYSQNFSILAGDRKQVEVVIQ